MEENNEIKRQEKPTFTFWYHINNNAHLRGKYVFDTNRMNDALNEALQQRQEEIISQIEDWNNIDGLNIHQIIERLKELK